MRNIMNEKPLPFMFLSKMSLFMFASYLTVHPISVCLTELLNNFLLSGAETIHSHNKSLYTNSDSFLSFKCKKVLKFPFSNYLVKPESWTR